jgi:hypothetical protein
MKNYKQTDTIDSNGRLITTIYYKRDEFDFVIVNFPFLCSNKRFHLLMVYISPSWFGRACFAYANFPKRGKLHTKKLVLQGYNESRLKSPFCIFYSRYNDFFKIKIITAHMLNMSYTGCITVIVLLALVTGNPVYLISTKGSEQVWPVSRVCLLLHGIRCHLCICPCCPTLDLVVASWIMITF